MTAVRVILITVAGPGGHVDVGVRSDVTPAELAASLHAVIGVSQAWPAAEHRAPPRPSQPRGRRSRLAPGDSLAGAGVADGDLVLFRSDVNPDVRAGHARSGQTGALAGPGAEQGADRHDWH